MDHLLWSYQRVLDTYGKPDTIGAINNGTVSWYYENVSVSKGRPRGLTIYFRDGLVSSANL